MKQLSFIFLLVFGTAKAQFDLDRLKDKVKEKNDEAVQHLKNKGKEKLDQSVENSRKEFDASNFNYAISFIDNSSTFENKEKGSTIGTSIMNARKVYEGQEKSFEERAYSNNRNGELLMAANKYHLAEQSFKTSKFFYESANISSGPDYAQVIGNLGLLYQSNGRYTKAKPFIDKAIELRQNESNKGMYAVTLNNKGVLLKDQGEYSEAELYFTEAIGILKDQNDNLGLALVFNNLAMAHANMAKLDVASTEMESSLDFASKVLKENSSNYIKLKINRAAIFRLLKKYEEAEKIYLAAIEVKEKKLGAHPDLAHLKRGLAGLYMEMGKPEQVEKLLLSAIDINKRKLGENHPATLSANQDLGNYYRYSNNPDKAIEILTSVVQKKKSIYGENHPDYIQSLEDLALSQWQGNRISEAIANYQTVVANTQNYINRFFNSLNENEKNLYWEKTSARLHRYYSFVLSNYSSHPDLLPSLYTTVINTKGLLLNTSSKIRNAIAESGDPELQQAYQSWLETKENLNTAYQLSKDELLEEKINLDSLERKADELERILSQKSALFRQSSVSGNLNYETISKTLQASEAAVEILEINDYANGFTGQSKYIAIVLNNSRIALAELGASSSIQRAVEEFRDKITNRKPEKEAFDVVWKPLEGKLTGSKKIYLALDGFYHQLSVPALKDAQGIYLADKYNFQLLGNTKDIISVKSNSVNIKPSSAFLIGNPTYGSNGVIEQLPGTEAEVNNIKTILTKAAVSNTALIGAKATETEVKKIKSPSILHIATHGFFLSDLSEVEGKKVLGVEVHIAQQNPLLRSGVLLANCENVFDENYRPANADNGILTAYEALSLNLDKTDLVVLSACETGLGSVKQGEGVFGLQRAFLIAGAKSLIMSLWSVSDEATMELMTLFYANYAKSGNKAQAFSDAQKQLKTKYKEPFYWAAFVMLSR